jgi:hypothetical protein
MVVIVIVADGVECVTWRVRHERIVTATTLTASPPPASTAHWYMAASRAPAATRTGTIGACPVRAAFIVGAGGAYTGWVHKTTAQLGVHPLKCKQFALK